MAACPVEPVLSAVHVDMMKPANIGWRRPRHVVFDLEVDNGIDAIGLNRPRQHVGSAGSPPAGGKMSGRLPTGGHATMAAAAQPGQ